MPAAIHIVADHAFAVTKHRFQSIDGLRGLAALLVLFHHSIHGLSEKSLGKYLAEFYHLVDFGKYGVELFFVISGFVIFCSLRSVNGLKDGWNFALRRQIRLDPPYWTVLILTLAYYQIRAAMPALDAPEHFSFNAILCNFCYLQYLTDAPSAVIVSWTLCLE